jgi:hydrogenase maturation protein HypF
MNRALSQAKIANAESLRLRIAIRGAVQGVGFRPFIYRLATELGVSGWVNNSPQGVFIEVEGDKERLERFLLRVEKADCLRDVFDPGNRRYLYPFTNCTNCGATESGARRSRSR